MSEPKGDCPFCSVPKWHICDHFVGYLRDGKVCVDLMHDRRRPLTAREVNINTGVTNRVYAKGKL